MVTLNYSYTAPVNRPGQSVLTIEQLWKGLMRKVRNAEEFVPVIIGCKLLSEEGGANDREPYTVTRIVNFDKAKTAEAADSVREVCKHYPPIRVDFLRDDGSKVENVVSQGPSGEPDDLFMTYIFESIYPDLKEGEELDAMRKKAIGVSPCLVNLNMLLRGAPRQILFRLELWLTGCNADGEDGGGVDSGDDSSDGRRGQALTGVRTCRDLLEERNGAPLAAFVAKKEPVLLCSTQPVFRPVAPVLGYVAASGSPRPSPHCHAIKPLCPTPHITSALALPYPKLMSHKRASINQVRWLNGRASDYESGGSRFDPWVDRESIVCDVFTFCDFLLLISGARQEHPREVLSSRVVFRTGTSGHLPAVASRRYRQAANHIICLADEP